jgi:lipoprotein-anchoring transpeptidase ErfK/SrfK
MSIRRLTFLCAAAAMAGLTCSEPARADLLIEVDKTAQRMTVTVDGHEVYKWAVATGGIDYDTPNGTFTPFRMDIDHHSDEWDNAPMPYAIFFTQTGNAIHGTYEQRSLGHAVSHGCVRLSLGNAASLWGLVKRQKMANTTVVVTGDIPGAKPRPEAIAAPKPANASDPFPRFPVAPDLFSLFH